MGGAKLTAPMVDALMLLDQHRFLPRAGRPLRGTLSRYSVYVLASTADALERRGLAVCSSINYVCLTPKGREVAARLHEERVEAESARERERLAARAEGMPPQPVLRVVRESDRGDDE